MPGRDERLATNEAYFRERNERVEEHVKAVAGERATFNVLCECSSMECAERIPLTSVEFEDAHRDPRQFIVAHGHVDQAIEDSVMRTDRFEVVRKRGDAGVTAVRAART